MAVMGPNRVVVADVVVTHAVCDSYLPASRSTSGAAAAKAEQRKRTAFGNQVAAAGFDFVPLATESQGFMGRAAMGLLSELSAKAASSGRVTKQAFMRSALSKLSCTLARGNSRMYATSTFAITHAAGRNYVSGSPVVIADAADE